MSTSRMTPTRPTPVVGILGGAVAGSEAAALVADRGGIAIVFEQNPRPYGKIEDGLPRWHEKLRKKEFQAIDANLSKPGVLFVPCTKLGRDISFADLSKELGLSALIMAHGAWRDRPLPVPGVDEYVGKGLVYQNPLVYWFNHYEEPGYDGPAYEIEDSAIVVGGGLASIDVVKIINLELYGRALRERGVEVDMVEMELKGIPAILERHELEAEDLGVDGCTLYYRRRMQDMPLASADNPTAEVLEKLRKARVKVMERVMRKYLVKFQDLSSPVEKIVEGDRLVGLVFRKNRADESGRITEVPGSNFEVRAPMVVSSIGSIPEALPGIPMKGELYQWSDWDRGVLEDGVFGLGNVLTGKGNIKDSRKNAREITAQILSDFLGVGEGDGAASTDALVDASHAAARALAEPSVAAATNPSRVLPPERIAPILRRVEARWAEVGYDGDYRSWIEKNAPAN